MVKINIKHIKSASIVLWLYSQSHMVVIVLSLGSHCGKIPVSERLQSSTGGRGGSWENVPTTLRSELMLYTETHGMPVGFYSMWKLGSKLAAGY